MPGLYGQGNYVTYHDYNTMGSATYDPNAYVPLANRQSGRLADTPPPRMEREPYRRGDRVLVRGWSCLVYLYDGLYLYVLPLGVTRYYKFKVDAVREDLIFIEEAVHV